MIETYISAFFDILYEENIASLTTMEEVRDAFHTNQIHSKNQAITALSHLPNHGGKVLYIGSWFGFLTHYICHRYPTFIIDEIDIDPRCNVISKRLNSKFHNYGTHFTEDVLTFDGLEHYDTIINLSSEHMTSEWFERIPAGKQCLIQSNNLSIEDHTNVCYSVDEIKNKYPLSSISYESAMKLNVLTRFTISGIK
jgi:hypothetical protein